jgi:LPPG:FO 2-phospho-L-lactate transferase
MIRHQEGTSLVVLSGGVGGARFLSGLVNAIPPENVTAIVNTGDDLVFHGLHVSPDIDIVTYTLAGIVNEEQGWGIERDSFMCLGMLSRLGHENWFRVGDRDLAVHLHRTQKLQQGYTLAQVTDDIRKALGVPCRIIPMTNHPVRTHIDTGKDIIAFQEYFVKRGFGDPVREVIYEGIQQAEAAPGVLEAIKEASAVIIAPGNPFLSIGTILSLKSVRDAIVRSAAQVMTISPIIGGRAVKGPTAEIMQAMGHEASVVGVAQMYRDLLDVIVIDERDRDLKPDIEKLGIRVHVTDTMMNTEQRRIHLAKTVLQALGLDQ